MFKRIYDYFKNKPTVEEIYYSNAVDLIDLENRMRNVQYGRAPWQKQIF